MGVHKKFTEKERFKKQLGLLSTTLYGLGIIIGAGVYVLIGTVSGFAGNSIWLSFLIAAVVASFTGLSYCELSSIFPKEAAEYVYTKEAFKSNLLSFLIGWVLIIALIVAATTVALGFANYVTQFFMLPVIPVAISLIVLLSFLNFYGIKQSMNVNMILTIIGTIGLLFIIFASIPYLGSVNYFVTPEGLLPAGISSVAIGAALIFFAYLGFDDLANISEETKNARKTIPRALILALVFSTIIYILVAISAVSVLGWEELAKSPAPLAAIATKLGGSLGNLFVTITAIFSTVTTALILLIAGSRFISGMAREQTPIPLRLSILHKKRDTPWMAILVIMLVAIALTFWGDLKTVASITTFSVFLAFAFVNLSVIWLRYKRSFIQRPFKCPVNIGKFPVLAFLGFITSLAMLFYFEPIIMAYELIILIAGILVFIVWKR